MADEEPPRTPGTPAKVEPVVAQEPALPVEAEAAPEPASPAEPIVLAEPPLLPEIAETSAPPEITKPITPPARPPREVIYRHSLVVRITHWINVLAISLLIMSGAQIFNAHPHLYWGQYGADADKPVLDMTAFVYRDGHMKGVTTIGGLKLNTTGLLAVSNDASGHQVARGFPSWLTVPSYQDLATGRHWHFFFAWVFVINGFVYLVSGLINGHLRRDLAPTGDQIRPSHILQSIWDHMRLKHPTGDEAKRYNILQKLAYLAVVFVLLPLMIGSGLTMSPGFDAVAPWLLTLFGGRQSARTIHFISANLIVLFVLVHVVEVFLAGVWNEVRSMITGRYVVPAEHHA
jgi:thiosulfate reductase cytochrome b subunit